MAAWSAPRSSARTFSSTPPLLGPALGHRAHALQRRSASGGSNLGPLNPALAQAVQGPRGGLRAADPGNTAPVPVDLVTASASGLDPHISVAAARYQAARVARARGLPEEKVLALVEQHTQAPPLPMLGEPVVNVLRLNLALDAAR
jgi:K+-transporting ATPase ATPase C chain